MKGKETKTRKKEQKGTGVEVKEGESEGSICRPNAIFIQKSPKAEPTLRLWEQLVQRLIGPL